MRIHVAIHLAMAALPMCPSALAQQHEFQRSRNPIGSEQAEIGYALRIEGDTAALGAPNQVNPSTGFLEGEVRVLERSEAGWELVQVLLPGNLTNAAKFGSSLDLSGDLLVVGAPLWGGMNAGPTQQFGRVYVYERLAGNWTLVQEIEPPAPHVQLGFGSGVAVEGNRLVVSAYNYDSGGFPTHPNGAFWVYERVPGGGPFVLRAEVTPPPYSVATSWGPFASHLDLDGDRILVTGCAFTTVGAAFTYTYANGTWSLEQVFERPSGPAPDRNFGFAVSLDGDRLVIGEPWGFPFGPGGNGRVYCYHLEPTGWVYDEYVHAPSPQALDRFGWSVDLRGDLLLVGAPEMDTTASLLGQSVLFQHLPGQGWTQRAVFEAEFPTLTQNLLGASVALEPDAGWALSGAPGYWDFDPNERTGSALFHTLDLGAPHCAGLVNSTGYPAELAVIGSSDTADQRVTLAAHHLPPNVFGVHLMGPASAPVPLASGQLCIGLPFERLFPILHTGSARRTVLDLDWSSPAVSQHLLPGSTWTFQLWYRDVVPGSGTANFSSAVTVTFD